MVRYGTEAYVNKIRSIDNAIYSGMSQEAIDDIRAKSIDLVSETARYDFTSAVFLAGPLAVLAGVMAVRELHKAQG
jgi:hypothetical protein